ncbi:MAG: ABC transporter substrate-binding protein [Sedimenticola sp.]|nr:ABC transporter substrate-binding protein [Sedimenticola sp.]MCW8880757.1 ABC transporter substrate-binding protein [Sedimenticola sp.]MCW8919895.1 ABC transporter substrate-binding protein [Sedimenticola sp.]MCW9022493.1 ABC transporter substrate-binding protein [Sedimenticola sp.]
MKNLILKLGLILFTSVSLIALATTTQVLAAEKHVAVSQIVEHPALDAARQGIQDELTENGYVVGKNLKWSYESAQGSPSTAAQIAKKFAGEKPDLVIGISTPSAQTLAASARGIPLIFSAVTDPLAAKLVTNLGKPGGLITGTSDALPIEKHLDLIQELVPTIKRLGVMFNPGEANSVSSVNQLRSAAEKRGWEIVEGGAAKTSEVLAAARSLVGKVDAIYVPTDNTVVSAFESVVRVGQQAKLPVIAGDTSSVDRGAIAAIGFNYYDVGRQTGRMAVRVLKGEKPGDIAVETVQKTELYLNKGSAVKMGVTFSDALIARATKVID